MVGVPVVVSVPQFEKPCTSINSILKDFDDDVLQLVLLLGFWALSTAQYSEQDTKYKLDLPPSAGEKMGSICSVRSVRQSKSQSLDLIDHLPYSPNCASK
jgi:hypothetical protein